MAEFRREVAILRACRDVNIVQFVVGWGGVAWHGWRGMAWHGMAWHGVAWRGMA